MKFGVGQTVKRVEDASLLIGKGNYTDDQMPGYGLAVAFLRSPFAHAQLTYLDLSAARTSDGVHLAAGQAEMDADNVGEIHCQQLWKTVTDLRYQNYKTGHGARHYPACR